jgi:hypothetical protein
MGSRADPLRFPARMRRIAPALAVVVASAMASAAFAAPAPQLPGHVLLVDRPGLRVYSPALRASTPCPRLLPLPAHALATVKLAVELAMPPFERRLHLDGHHPVVRVALITRSGVSYVAGGCGRAAWARSVYADVSLPRVTDSASLAQHRFAVGRVRQGWVLWGYIH